MDITVVDVHHPWWFSLSLVVAVAYPFLAFAVRRTASDVRLVVLLPVVVANLGASIGVVHLVGGLATTGVAPHALAAGSAEVLLPISAGAASMVVLIVAFAMRPARATYIHAVGTLIVIVELMLFACVCLLLWRLQSDPVSYAAGYGVAARMLAAAQLAATAALVVSIRNLKRFARPVLSERRCLAPLAILGLALAGVVGYAVNQLRLFAIG
jgi:hypothetical protein